MVGLNGSPVRTTATTRAISVSAAALVMPLSTLPAGLTAPLLKDDEGNQKNASWDQALGKVATKLKEIIAANGGTL